MTHTHEHTHTHKHTRMLSLPVLLCTARLSYQWRWQDDWDALRAAAEAAEASREDDIEDDPAYQLMLVSPRPCTRCHLRACNDLHMRACAQCITCWGILCRRRRQRRSSVNASMLHPRTKTRANRLPCKVRWCRRQVCDHLPCLVMLSPALPDHLSCL
jgi:hypothetical protein